MLKETLSKFFKIDSLIENLTGFVEARVALLKVELKEEAAKGLAKGTAWLLIGLVLLLFIVFLSITLALFVGTKLGTVAGFLTVSVFYCIVGLVLFLLRARIIARLENTFTHMFRKKTDMP